MSAPAFILEAETAYSTASPKSTAAFNVLQTDVLIAYAGSQDNTSVVSLTNSGLALAWTLLQSVNVASFGWTGMWGVASSQSRAAVTATLTRSAGTGSFGGDALLFRGSDGIGATAVANSASGTPTVNVTTTAANSAIAVCVVDFNAIDGTASRVWRTAAGPMTETTFSFNVSLFTIYGGYHPDAGPIGTYAVGLTAPAGQAWAIVAAEVKSSVPGLKLAGLPLRLRG